MTICTPDLQIASTLNKLLVRQELSSEEIEQWMQALMTGRCGEAETAALLVALRAKGETAGEIAAAATVLRRHMQRWDPGRAGVLDTCGTGGDHSGTFNISTATALVVAACGVPVVKHGNRAASGRTGSADVLAELGVRIDGDSIFVRRCLDRAGVAFCLAPLFHPALRHVAAVRQRLGVPTLFNFLGPLANPAGVEIQLIGVSRPELLDVFAVALSRLGTRRALVVMGSDGLDEVSLSAPTLVRQVIGQDIRAWEWRPGDFGLPTCIRADLQVGNVAESAAMIQRLLNGEIGPPAHIVMANAAAALLAAERVQSPREGVELAASALQSGRAADVLTELIRESHV
jgi:anthranilate phosphoribosyltransferase